MLRRIALVSLLLAVALSVGGTGAFSAVSADRGVSVGVAPDSQALLGVDVVETTGTVGEPFTLLELTDRFAQDVDLHDISLVGATPIRLETTAPAGIGGDGDPLAVAVTCEESGSETVELRIEASGGGVHVTKWKRIEVTCEEPQPQPNAVTFNGCGNVFLPDLPEGSVVTYHAYLPGEDEFVDRSHVNGPGQLVGVTIDGDRYDNPHFDFEEEHCGPAGNAQ